MFSSQARFKLLEGKMTEQVQPGEETVFVADNVDEFVERTRLKQILEARQRAGESLRNAELRRINARQEGAPGWQASQAAAEPARAAVESYIYEVERLYRGTEEGRKLWDDTELGELDIAKTVSLGSRQDIGEVVDIQLDGRSLTEVGTTLRVSGVSDYLELSGREVTITHERELPRRGSPTETATETAQISTPVSLSRDAFRATNALLAASDLGVKVDVGDDVADHDYVDVLDDLDNE